MIADAFLSLLPERYRRRYQSDPVGGTLHSAILQVLGGFGVYAALFFRYLQQFGALSGTAMAGEGSAGQDLHALSFGVGVIGWLAFSITPGPLLAMYFMLEGVVRGVSAVVTLEPLSSLPFWIVGQAHSGVERLWARQAEPPPAPDLVELPKADEDWDLRITCVRPKPDWHALVQVEYNGVHYRIGSSGPEEVEGEQRFRYYLQKATGTEGFRGIVRYDPFAYWKNSDE